MQIDGFSTAIPEKLAERAIQTVENGYKALKWDPFGTSEREIESSQLKQTLAQVKAVRNAVGDEIDILIEGYGRFNTSAAIKISKELEQYKPFFFRRTDNARKFKRTCVCS